MSTSIMTLYCCLLSHFPEHLYNFLIFSKNMCSYRELLLKNLSNTMVTIFCSIFSDCNTDLRITIICYYYPMEIIVSTTFGRSLDLEHCISQAVLPSVWKQRHSFPYWDSLWCIILSMLLIWRWSWYNKNWTWQERLLLDPGSVELWLCFLVVTKYCDSEIIFT